MSSSHRIHDVIYDYPMADVEEYFNHMNGVIGLNSGTNDYQMVTHDCYSNSAPIKHGQNARFRLTDSSIDIIDISQGYINLTAEIQIKMIALPYDNRVELNNANIVPTVYSNLCWWFVGFKSGSHIIRSYAVYTNGQATSCKQVSAVEEQAIVYSCKSKEERKARPGMYSCHEDVCKMRNCVCGTYIQQPLKWERPEATKRFYTAANDNVNNPGWHDGKYTIKLEICMQIDDLLPFSGMTYFPRFACGELELEIKFALEKNMVFCQVPIDEVLHNRILTNESDFIHPMASQVKFNYRAGTGDDAERGQYVYTKLEDTTKANSTFEKNSLLPMFHPGLTDQKLLLEHKISVDSRFHQFGQWQRAVLGNADTTKGFNAKDITVVNNQNCVDMKNDMLSNIWVTFVVGNEQDSNASSVVIDQGALNITEAQSHVYGFNIKSTAKENIAKEIRANGLIIPAQWIQYNQFNMGPQGNYVKYNGVYSFWEVGQLLFTFNDNHCMTVSRNPYLEDVRCQLGNRLIPDKGVSTNSNEYAEMAISALGFDTLFSGSEEFINSITPIEERYVYNNKFRLRNKDDSDWMFVCDLERNGNGTYADGFSGRNVPVNFSANMINEKNNPFWYAFDITTTTKDNFKYPRPNYNGGDVTDEIKNGTNTYPLNTNIKCHCFAVGDAYWKFDTSGGRFIKDSEIISLIKDREEALKDKLTQRSFQKNMMDAQGGDPYDPMARYRLNAETNNQPNQPASVLNYN